MPKQETLSDAVFRCRMTTSIVTILACTVVMVSSAFALFYSEVSTADSTLQGAYYDISVSPAVDHSYLAPLAYEDQHHFVITAVGTASTGYCVITVDDAIYTTPAIPRGESLQVTVTAAAAAQITFTPVWGASPTPQVLTDLSAPQDSAVMEIYHSETPHTVYTTEPCARIADIASFYNVSESDICVYNNLTDPSALTVGTALKIPGVPSDAPLYAVPYAIYTVEPTACLTSIAAYYGVSEGNITAFNSISDNNPMTVGMTLKLPNVDPTHSTYSVPYAEYTVEPAAVFSDIAAYYGISEEAILAYNGMTVSEDGLTVLTEGTVLRIPGVSPDTPPYAAPIPEPPTNTDENTNDRESHDSPAAVDTVSGGDADESDLPTEPQPPQEMTDPAVEPTESVNEDTAVSGGDSASGEQPAVEMPAENSTSPEEVPAAKPTTEEPPAPVDTSSSSEGNGGEEPTEVPTPTGDETPADTGTTE